MLVYVAFALLAAFGVVAGGSSGPSVWRRTASIAVALVSLATPFVVPAEHLFLRALVALGAALILMRAIDLARDKAEYPLHIRIGMMFCTFDLRGVRAIVPQLELGCLFVGLVYALASLSAYYAALHLALPWRWLFGAAGVYCMADSAAAFADFASHALGASIPKQHDTPILSRSVREFWSSRWNLNVRDWLFRHCHRPLARRGRHALGIGLAFLASTLLHFWMVIVPLGWFWALVMASFFIIQGGLVLFESRLSVRSWPDPAQRAWTVVAVLGPSPLFVEPALRLIG